MTAHPLAACLTATAPRSPQMLYRVYEPSELKPVLEAVNAEMTKEKEKEKK